MKNENDWRLQGQEKYLMGITLRFTKYETYSETWDHDHCAFCWCRFSTSVPDALKEGYTTLDDYHWICSDCYNDFKEEFKWVVVE